MITSQQRTKILALIESCFVYERQVAFWDAKRKKPAVTQSGRELIESSYKRAFKNADESGKALIAYLNSITEESCE